jgi:plastocyanin
MDRVRWVIGWLGLVALLGCGDATPPRRDVVPTPLDLTTVGTITVTVTFEGTVPPRTQLNMRSTPACAAAHPGPVYDDTLLVHDGRLANAVVWIKDGLGERVFASPETAVVIDQEGCLYAPRVAAAMIGQPVTFTNSDTEPHNVHGHPGVARAWNFMISRPGGSRTVYVEKPEVAIPIGCDVHPWMRAYLAVFEHPYFSITAADGIATLEQVPPGDYVVAAWHERLGVKEQAVTADPKGAVAVRFTYTGS